MQSNDFVKLLNCTARFINYGKHNVLSIFEWEQIHLSKQTGKQAVLLKSYNKWNGIENKIVSGKGVDLDIDGCNEKIRFFDISQTSEPKHGRKAKENTESIAKDELTEIPSTDPIEIHFPHKYRGLLLTALWTELSLFQNEYEKSFGGSNENILRHIGAIYIIHSHFKSNWQDDSEVKAVFDTFRNEYMTKAENNDTSLKVHLLGAFFSLLFQFAINLIVKIEKRFEMLVSNSDSEASENYYMKIRFYEICDKEKVAVCRLKSTEKISTNLSIESYEIIETLPYKPEMEREAFLEYLQSIFNNGLTEEHLVLVRRRNIYGATVVTTYRVEVRNWGVKQDYINFNIEISHYPISFYLRQISSEYLNSDGNGGTEAVVQPTPQLQTQAELQPEKQTNTQIQANSKPKEFTPISTANSDSDDSNATKVADTPKNPEPTKTKKANQGKSKPIKKKHTNILDKVNKLKEDLQNKSF